MCACIHSCWMDILSVSVRLSPLESACKKVHLRPMEIWPWRNVCVGDRSCHPGQGLRINFEPADHYSPPGFLYYQLYVSVRGIIAIPTLGSAVTGGGVIRKPQFLGSWSSIVTQNSPSPSYHWMKWLLSIKWINRAVSLLSTTNSFWLFNDNSVAILGRYSSFIRANKINFLPKRPLLRCFLPVCNCWRISVYVILTFLDSIMHWKLSGNSEVQNRTTGTCYKHFYSSGTNRNVTGI